MNKRSNLSRKCWGNRNKIRLSCAVFASLFVLSCAPAWKQPAPVPDEEASRLLAFLTSTEKYPETFKGIGTLTVLREGRSQKMRTAWLGAMPGRLRIESLGPWGHPLFFFLLDDGTFHLRVAGDDRFLRGKATADNLSRVLPIAVDGPSLVGVLAGRPPVVSFQKAQVEPAEGGQGPCLALYGRWNRLVEKIWFGQDRTTPQKAVLFDRWGNSKCMIRFGLYRQVNQMWLPFEIEITEKGHAGASLVVERLWTGVTVSDAPFAVDLMGMEVVDLGA